MSAWLASWLVIALLGDSAPNSGMPVSLETVAEVDLRLLVVPPPEGTKLREPDVDIRRHLRPGGSILEARYELDRHLDETTRRRTVIEALRARVEFDLNQRNAAFAAAYPSVERIRGRVDEELLLVQRIAQRSSPLSILSRQPSPTWAQLLAEGGLTHWVKLKIIAHITAYTAIHALSVAFTIDIDRRTRNLRHLERMIAVLDQEIAWDRTEQDSLRKAVVEKAEFYAAYANDMEKVNEDLKVFIKEMLAVVPVRPRLYIADNSGKVTFPIRNGTIEAGYGTRTHLGVKALWQSQSWAAPATAPRGADPKIIKSIYWGYVLWTGWIKGLGRTVIVDHTQGYVSIYGHLSEFTATLGEKIPTGTAIGIIGETESFFGPRLHFEVRLDGQPQNPIRWFR